MSNSPLNKQSSYRWFETPWCPCNVTALYSSYSRIYYLFVLSFIRARFCLLLGVSSVYAQPITCQVTEVTCPVIGRAQPELTPSKRQKNGPRSSRYEIVSKKTYSCQFDKQLDCVAIILFNKSLAYSPVTSQTLISLSNWYTVELDKMRFSVPV